jgi:hypothetical protein
MLAGEEVHGQGPHVRPPTRRAFGFKWETGCGRGPTIAAASLGEMFGDFSFDVGKIEDLAGLDANDLSVGQTGAAIGAAGGRMYHDLIRILAAGQIAALVSGLLPGTAFAFGLVALGCSPLGSFHLLGVALRQRIGRRRFGTVPRVLSEVALEFGYTSLKDVDNLTQLSITLTQLSILGFELTETAGGVGHRPQGLPHLARRVVDPSRAPRADLPANSNRR